MSTTDIKGWSTANELEFVSTLAARMDAKNLLRNYLIAARKRTKWDRIDQARVISMAEGFLAAAEQKRAA